MSQRYGKMGRATGAVIGCALGCAAAPTALAMRMVYLSGSLTWTWIRAELNENAFFYAYMAAATPAVFLMFGSWLGSLSDRISFQKQELERLSADLKRQAVTDELTGLFNRRQLFKTVEKEVDRARRYGRALTGMMVDIDDFKQVNDRHGHMAGDRVIRETAERLKRGLRRVDTVGRYAGDEFFIILPETGSEAANRVAERLRVDIRGHRYHAPTGDFSVTVSIGVFSFKGTELFDQNVFIEKIDQTMFRAKRAGKDRVFLSAA